MPNIEEKAMRSRSPQGDAPSLERLLQADIGALEASLPSLVDHAIRRPVIVTRSVAGALVFLPLDACSRLWAGAPRPPVIDAQSDPDS